MTNVKRAGDVVGTPDWQLDRMYETDTEQMLEKAYAEDDFPLSDIQAEFSRVTYYIGLAVGHLVRAANTADKYGRAEKIDGLIEKLDDDIPYNMSQVLKGLKEGA